MLLLLVTMTNMAQRPVAHGGRQDSLCSKASVFFPINDNRIVRDYSSNRSQLSRIDSTLQAVLNDTTLTLLRLSVNGYGSPEGRHSYNQQMARERADSLRAYVLSQGDLPQDRIVTRSIPEDWDGLAAFVEATPDGTLRHKQEILQIIRSDRQPGVKEWLIRQAFPKDFAYLLDNGMPLLRRSDLRVDYLRTIAPEPEVEDSVVPIDTLPLLAEVADTPVEEPQQPDRCRMILKTNLLYDVVLLPNIGVEIPLGKRWSVSADWFYTWFSSDRRHRYWQSYGGYLTVRRYFGKNSMVNGQRSMVNGQRSMVRSTSGRLLPKGRKNGQCSMVNGHHLGLYVLGLTYDVEWGGRGYQADHFGFGGGIEYGYALPIGRRLSLDFTLGVGFQDGEYKEYDPIDNCYVWDSTHKRHWWGPTKAEVTLKWNVF